MPPPEQIARRRWSAHPWRARSLRLFVYAIPIGLSLVFVHLASSFAGAPTASLWVFLLWWLAMSLIATVVVSFVYALCRRLLPLGALLELSLVFPDEAPSRFSVALRAGTVASLEERLRLMRQAGEAPSAQEAAEILLQLVGALSVHDKITRGHAERVRGYAYMLGKQLGLASDDLDRLNWAALLHDIGKLEVGAEILNKPGRPTDEEWEILRLHPLYGETIVQPLAGWLGEWVGAVGYHHEHWDGAGYPRGVAGEAIPLSGRLVAIADVFDVITSARSYKEAATMAAARAEIARCAGTQFDPRLVRAFVNVSLGRMRVVAGPLAWLTHAPLLGRMPLTPSVGAALGGIAALVTAAATGIAGAHEPARAAASMAIAPRHVAETSAPAPSQVTPLDRMPKPAAKTAAPGTTEPVDEGAAAIVPAEQAAATPPEAEPPAPAAAEQAEPPAPTPPSAPQTPPTQPPADSPEPSESPPTPPESPAPSTPLANVRPSFSVGASQATLEDAGPQSIPGWATGISSGPASEASQAVSFTVGVDTAGLFAVQPAVAANGTLTYTPAADATGVATVSVTAVDDGGTANGGADTSASQTFTITVGAVNDAPDFNPGANQALLEDAAAQAVAGWATGIVAGPANESAQGVGFTVSADLPALFSAQPAVGSNGTLTYTPAADASGVATVTVAAVDNGGTADGGADTGPARTFTITIGAVNDVPGFTVGAGQSVLEDAGTQSVGGWASGISAGPASESSQSVSFSVSADLPGLFAVQPAVAANGMLSYTPASNGNGVAIVTVAAVDSGGTANGGVDTSPTQVFTITIGAVNDAPSFSAGGNQSVLLGLGTPQSVPGWATGIAAGPADESSQSVVFTVSSDNPGLFAVQPAVAADGTLTYTPALLTLGTATVTVRAVDDGGTALGGVDTSAPQFFTISVVL